MDTNLEYYKIFYYVGKFQSITQAAGHLALSQPAVSQAIKNLEKNIGGQLFFRTPKGVRFTGEGELLYSYVKKGYEIIKQGERRYEELLDPEGGEICIGASDMTLQFFLLEHLEAFHEQYPRIKVRVTNAPTPETLLHLQEGKIDFGVVSSPLIEKPNLLIHPVRKIKDVFVAGRKFLALKDQILSYGKLEELPIVCLEGTTSTREYVEAFLARKKVRIHPEFELATSDMLIQFAIKSMGVASVVKDFALEYEKKGELFCLNFEEEIPEREFCVVYQKNQSMSRAAKQLLALLVPELDVV